MRQKKILVDYGFWILLWAAPPLLMAWISLQYFVPIVHHELIDSLFNINMRGLIDVGQIAEHKLIFPRLFLQPIVWLVPKLQFPHEAAMVFNQIFNLLCSALNFILIASIAWRLPFNKAKRCLLVLGLSLFIFTFAQWENWTALGGLFFFSVTFFLLGLFSFLHLKHPLDISMGAICAFITTFSIGGGVGAWVALFPLLWIKNNAQNNFKRSITWITLCGLSLALYAYGVNFSIHPGTALVANNQSPIIFFLTLLGGHLIPSTGEAVAAGCIIIGIAVYTSLKAFKLEKLYEAMPWICLFIFVILQLSAITLGRSSLGAEYALSSRYASIELYGTVAAFSLIAITTRSTAVIMVGVIIAVVSNILSFSAGFASMAGRSNIFLHARACLQTYTYAPSSCLGQLYSGKGEVVREAAAILDTMGALQIFHVPENALVAAYDPKMGSLETVSPLSDGSAIFSGWAMLQDCRQANHILLTTGVSRSPLAHTVTLYKRDDVKMYRRCNTPSAWKIRLDADGVLKANGMVDAWSYDEKTHTLWSVGSIKL